ncbi:outer membrane protein assembly factor BamB family protein [Haloarchaeobius sp. DT45]|uniref:outer membrane protein assembly factor BamB family protein n=1 Tax=Haloarchaeobius sp. DT45 TaxID=3446116 RepID=UPI003F6D3E95
MVNGLTNRRGFLTAFATAAAVGVVHPGSGAAVAARTPEKRTWSGYRGGPEHSGTATVDGITTVERTRWTVGDEDNVATLPAVVDGTAYLGVGSRLLAVDVQSGVGTWVADMPAQVPLTPCVGENTVVATTNEGDVVAVDRANGTEQWSVGIGGLAGAPAVSEGTVYVGNSNGRLLALDVGSGEVQWSVRRDDIEIPDSQAYVSAEEIRPAPAVSDGSLYVNTGRPTGGGKLVCLDAETGAERWSHSFDHDYVLPPAIDGNRLVAASEYGELKVFSKVGGSVQWETDFDVNIGAPPAFDGETVAVVAPVPRDSTVHAFDAATGNKRWEYQFEEATTPGGVSIADGVVYGMTFTGGRSGIVAALDYDAGLEQFTFETGRPRFRTPTPVENGVVIPDGPQVRCLGSEAASGQTASDGPDSGDGSPTDDTAGETTNRETSEPSGTSDQDGQSDDTGGDGSRSFFGGDSGPGGNTLTIVSTAVTVLGTFVGLVQLLRGD